MYRYTITDEEYRELGKWMLIEKRGTGAKAIVSILLRTVIQMDAVACLIIFMPEAPTWMKWMLGILSVIWALLSLFQYSFFDVRAGMLLKQSKSRPDYADYWKEHHLNVDEDSFRLAYGDIRLEVSYADVTEIKDTENLHLILSGKDIFDAVPKRSVRDSEWEKIAENALASRMRVKRESLDGLRNMLQDAPFKTYIRMSHDEMAEKLVRMTRQSFRYTCGWSMLTAFTFFFPLALGVITIMQGGSWATVALCFGTFILFNMRLFIIFTKAAKDMMKRKLLTPSEDGYLLAVKDRTAYLVGDVQAYTYDLNDMKKHVRTDDGLFLYFSKQAMLFVPSSAADGFLTAAGLRKSLHSLAAAQGTLAEAVPEEEAEDITEALPGAVTEAAAEAVTETEEAAVVKPDELTETLPK